MMGRYIVGIPTVYHWGSSLGKQFHQPTGKFKNTFIDLLLIGVVLKRPQNTGIKEIS